MNISIETVKALINEQFPQYSNLEIRPVEKSGHDNRTFHLGDTMSIRLPSSESYVPQVEKESKWLPILSKNLSLPITTPVEKGMPSDIYPYSWSINKWISGETVNEENVNLNQFAIDLANFLKEFQSIDCTGGPVGGTHNFFRGGDLSVYHDETQNALKELSDLIDTKKCSDIWNKAINSKYTKAPVWVHGDIAPGNLLVENNRLCAVIDFGILGIGDPSCDLAMAYTFFDKKSRAEFIKSMNVDKDMWDRAKGWALWKALITYDKPESQKVVQVLLNDNTL